MNSTIRIVYAVCAVVVFYGNVHNYLHDHHGIGVPWHWVLAFIVFSLPVLFKQVMQTDLLRQPIVLWCLGYAWLTMVWFLWGPQSDMAWQEVRWRVLAIVEMLSFLAVFMDAQADRFARITLVIGVHVGIAINIYELFVPMSFSNVFGRSAGLYLSPNLAGEALVLGMILGITVLPVWYRGIFVLLTAVGVFVTFSRGGLVGWGIGLGGLLLGRFIGVTHLVRTGLVAMAVVTLVLLPKADDIMATLERSGSLNANVLERLAWLMDPSGVSDASSWSRKYVAQQAWERVGEQPFLGGGTGAVHERLDIPPHNQFLAYMMDHGLLGAMLLPLLLLALLWRAQEESLCVGLIFCCAVLWFSFFTHTMLNNSHSLLLFSLMAALASTRLRRMDRVVVSRTVAEHPLPSLARTHS